MPCFQLEERRSGEICNACVLLVKRFKKLPPGSNRNWKHVSISLLLIFNILTNHFAININIKLNSKLHVNISFFNKYITLINQNIKNIFDNT